MKIEKDRLIEIEETKASPIREMREDSIGEIIGNSIEERKEILIEAEIGISINHHADQKILGLGQSFVVNVEPVNSGLSQELEGIAVITRICPLKL